MNTNPLLALADSGQSVWLDYVSRPFVTSGELAVLVDNDGVTGLTSNPAIFERAIARTGDYDDAILHAAETFDTPEAIYETLAIEDIQLACDTLRGVYDGTAGADGYVSLEVSPHLAHDTRATIDQARSLWCAVGRPNVCIKVPATSEGLPAIRSLIDDGINVNVTLIFSLTRYEQVANAYLEGLEMRAARREPVDGVMSVASFFLSRVDVAIDPLLARISDREPERAATAAAVRGRTAVAMAKVAYQMYREIFGGPRFRSLAEATGARPQRLLWASTGTKSATESDVKYIEPLIGPATITTMPRETLEAYRDHGHPAPRLEEGLGRAYETLAAVADLGVDLAAVSAQLEREGLEKFTVPFDHLLSVVDAKRDELVRRR